jgi:hypothetical protein
VDLAEWLNGAELLARPNIEFVTFEPSVRKTGSKAARAPDIGSYQTTLLECRTHSVLSLDESSRLKRNTIRLVLNDLARSVSYSDLGTDMIKNSAEKLGSLVERLLTIRYRRRRELFSELLDPLFTEFQLVHKHYTKLLERYEGLLPFRRQETEDGIDWILSEGGELRRLSESEEGTVLRQIIKEAKQSSELTAPIRKLFRTKVAGLLRRLRHEPERRFLLALLAYFGSAVHGDINHWDFQAQPGISATIDRLLKNKVTADAFIELTQNTSVGESIEDLLIDTTEYEYPRQFILATRQWIDEAYVQVGNEFQSLKYDVINEAPI